MASEQVAGEPKTAQEEQEELKQQLLMRKMAVKMIQVRSMAKGSWG